MNNRPQESQTNNNNNNNANNNNNNNANPKSEVFPLSELPHGPLAATLSSTPLSRLFLLSRCNKKLSSCFAPSIQLRLARLGVVVPNKMPANKYLKFLLRELSQSTPDINTKSDEDGFGEYFKVEFIKQLKAGF